MFRSNSSNKGKNSAPSNDRARPPRPSALDLIGLRREPSTTTTTAGGPPESSKRRRLTLHRSGHNSTRAVSSAVPSTAAGGSVSNSAPPDTAGAESSAYERFDERNWLRGLAYQIRRAVNRPSSTTPTAHPLPSTGLKRSASRRSLTPRHSY